MSSNVPFALGQLAQGVPYTGMMQSLLQQGLLGGQGTASFFQFQYNLLGFYQWLQTQDASAWAPGTDSAGNPTYAISQGPAQVQVASTLDQSVIQQQTTPDQFQWNGTSYNIVGTLEATLSFDAQPVWYIEVPLGVAEAYPAAQLAGLVWSQLLQPLVSGFLAGVRSCVAAVSAVGSDADAAAVATDAAADAAVEGEIVAGVEVSLAVGAAALAGLVVLLAIPFLLSFLLHPTYHNLRVYNLTPYDITWTPYIIEGAMNMAPTTGQGQSSYYTLIPAMSSYAPPGVDPVPVAAEADFSVASTSEVTGLGYAMGFALSDPASGAPVTEAAIAFDIPYWGDNSLFASWGPVGDPTQYYEAMEGEYHQLEFQIATSTPDGSTLTLTITYDYLDGEHGAPGGGSAYLYNSLAVFTVS